MCSWAQVTASANRINFKGILLCYLGKWTCACVCTCVPMTSLGFTKSKEPNYLPVRCRTCWTFCFWPQRYFKTNFSQYQMSLNPSVTVSNSSLSWEEWFGDWLEGIQWVSIPCASAVFRACGILTGQLQQAAWERPEQGGAGVSYRL